jgi:hypothetical protein
MAVEPVSPRAAETNALAFLGDMRVVPAPVEKDMRQAVLGSLPALPEREPRKPLDGKIKAP